jgi:3-methyladenine DNA glycosylase AlkD
MTVKEVLAQLKSMGDEALRAYNAKVGPDGAAGAGDNQFGVKLGDIRALARKIKTDHELAIKLWDTGNVEAQLLATLIIKPASLSAEEVDRLTRSTSCTHAAEWMNNYVVAQHPEKEALRAKWMKDKDRWAARAGWHLTASRVNKGAGSAARRAGAGGAEGDADRGAGLDLPALLDRIEKEMPKAPPETQWTMNNTLLAIGIKHAAHRKRAIAIGEKIGLYKDWPASKGCIIPYVPVAVEALVKRQA